MIQVETDLIRGHEFHWNMPQLDPKMSTRLKHITDLISNLYEWSITFKYKNLFNARVASFEPSQQWRLFAGTSGAQTSGFLMHSSLIAALRIEMPSSWAPFRWWAWEYGVRGSDVVTSDWLPHLSLPKHPTETHLCLYIVGIKEVENRWRKPPRFTPLFYMYTIVL